jgi:uncharacterized membrane protein
MNFFRRHGFFLVLLLLGAILRFLFISVQGLSHDELSAWNRIGDYDFFGVLEYGVKPDMHPAFMQVLLQYWVQLFGDAEWVFRIPSTVFGLSAVILMYLLAHRFLSKEAGLFTAVLFLFLVFPVMHSALARPYAPGLFFIMLQLYGILKLEHSRIRKTYFWSSALIVLGSLGAIYAHYYAGLVAGLIGLSALFYVSKNRWAFLMFSGIIALLLFLPHWEITKEHLSRDGLGWLGSPETSWFLDFMILFFNGEFLFFSGFFILMIFLLIRQKFRIQPAYRFLLLTFVFVYAVSHLVSLFYTPILREPGVLMILPLLFLGLSGLIQNIHEPYFKSAILLIALVFSSHSFVSGELLKTAHFEPFREMTELIKEADETYEEDQILRFCNVTNINYLNYYARQNGASLDFEMTLIEEIDEIHQMAKLLETSEKPYCMLARTNRAQNVIQLEIIRHFYPEVVMHRGFFNANFTVWKRGAFAQRKFKGELNASSHPNLFESWNVDTSSNEFIGDLRIPVKLLRFKGTYLLIETMGWVDDSIESLNFVVVAERDGELIKDGEHAMLYQAWDQMQLLSSSGVRRFFTAVELPKKLNDSDVIHVYFWNRNFVQVKLEKPRIYVVQAGF